MFFVYVLESSLDGSIYIGQTNNTVSRLERHNWGLVKSTRNKKPWKIIHTEEYHTRGKAMAREKYLKSLKNSKYIKENIINKIVAG